MEGLNDVEEHDSYTVEVDHGICFRHFFTDQNILKDMENRQDQWQDTCKLYTGFNRPYPYMGK